MINGFVMQPRVPATHGVVPDDSRTCGQPRRAGCLWTKSGARDPGRGQDVTVQDLRTRPARLHTCLHRSGSKRPSSISRSEEHTSELQSLMRISYAVFCLKKKTKKTR